jgi:hypothetical protein
VPLYNFVPRGFGFVHHSIAILDHEVPNPNLTIRHFCIAARTSTVPATSAHSSCSCSLVSVASTFLGGGVVARGVPGCEASSSSAGSPAEEGSRSCKWYKSQSQNSSTPEA